MSKGPTTGPTPAKLVDGTPAFAGRLTVLARLGTEPEDLLRRHPEPGELRTLATLVSRQAERLDGLDQELRRSAAEVIGLLSPIRAGDHREIRHFGTLRSRGTDLETAGARFDLATEHLAQATYLYQEATKRLSGTPATARAVAARSRVTSTATPDTEGSSVASVQSSSAPHQAPRR
ncbi:hypothetical protein [Kitasatospora sp. NPDC001095]